MSEVNKVVTFYTTGKHCPNCSRLETYCINKGYEYEEIIDTDALVAISQETGINSQPIVEIERGHYVSYDEFMRLESKASNRN